MRRSFHLEPATRYRQSRRATREDMEELTLAIDGQSNQYFLAGLGGSLLIQGHDSPRSHGKFPSNVGARELSANFFSWPNVVPPHVGALCVGGEARGYKTRRHTRLVWSGRVQIRSDQSMPRARWNPRERDCPVGARRRGRVPCSGMSRHRTNKPDLTSKWQETTEYQTSPWYWSTYPILAMNQTKQLDISSLMHSWQKSWNLWPGQIMALI